MNTRNTLKVLPNLSFSLIKLKFNSCLTPLIIFSIFACNYLSINAQTQTKHDSFSRLHYVLPQDIGLDSNFIYFQIDSIATNGINERAFPGCQILAAKDGAIFFHKTYGFHTYDSINPVKKADLYDFASVTKITGPLPALMKLYDEGKFKLDTNFAAYWPDFRRSNKKELKIRDILAHQGQLQPWISFWKMTQKKNGGFKGRFIRKDSSKKNPVKIAENLYLHKKYYKKIYKAISKSPLTEQKAYKYSGLSFFVYPELIQRLTGEKYEDYVKNNFYNPLGAKTITYNPLYEFAKSTIIPTEYDSIFRKQQIHGTVHDEGAAMMGGVSGNAGLFGTTLDLAKVMQMYLNCGEYGGIRFISHSTIKEFTRHQFIDNENRRGLGFDKPLLKNKENGSTAIDAGDKSFGHSGYTGTFCWADPETGILFVFMSNRVYPTRNNSKLYQLNIRPAIHQVLYDAVKELKIKN